LNHTEMKLYCRCRRGTHGEYRNEFNLEDRIVDFILTLMRLSPAIATETISEVSIVNVGEDLTRAGRAPKAANILSTR